MEPRIHAQLHWNGRSVVLRDLDAPDLPLIADYWLSTENAMLEQMGVHQALLGDAQAIIARFEPALPSGDSNQAKLGFAFEVDGEVAGYTNLNRYSPEVNYSHWHVFDPAFRQGGLSSLLYPYRLRTYFDLVPIERLIHQTRPENVGVNRLLDRFVPIAETRFVDKPDGLSTPGVFNLRYVTREDLPRIMAKASGDGLT